MLIQPGAVCSWLVSRRQAPLTLWRQVESQRDGIRPRHLDTVLFTVLFRRNGFDNIHIEIMFIGTI